MSSNEKETREKILEATAALLVECHGAGVRMSDIAKRVGISRQAVYLHFPKRSELLVATTRYLDAVHDVDKRLEASRQATSGQQRLDSFIDAWGYYIPEIYGVARALISMQEQDEAAAAAWDDRMQAMRAGCRAAVLMLEKDGKLNAAYKSREATDLLWTLLSVENWEQLTRQCGWSDKKYVQQMQQAAQALLVKQ